jgi:hypothetical protein
MPDVARVIGRTRVMISGTVHGNGPVVVTRWVPSVVILGSEGSYTMPVRAVEPLGTLPVEWPPEAATPAQN